MDNHAEATGKQEAKRLVCETADENGVEYEFEHYRCPRCNIILHQRHKRSKVPMRYHRNYCHECGQRLDWGYGASASTKAKGVS
jgi:uncharacterized protein with PIN domain